jgi:hypothetical protein
MSNDIFTAYANLSGPAGTSRFTGVEGDHRRCDGEVHPDLKSPLDGRERDQQDRHAGPFQVGMHLAITTPMVPLHPRKAPRSQQRLFNLLTVLICRTGTAQGCKALSMGG